VQNEWRLFVLDLELHQDRYQGCLFVSGVAEIASDKCRYLINTSSSQEILVLLQETHSKYDSGVVYGQWFSSSHHEAKMDL
jgi:hypothetical protein